MSAPHPLGTLELDACRVPAQNRVGDEGRGFMIGMATLDQLRPTVGAAACGLEVAPPPLSNPASCLFFVTSAGALPSNTIGGSRRIRRCCVNSLTRSRYTLRRSSGSHAVWEKQ